MSLMTEQHISAQIWICDHCGGQDPKSCGCAAATATSREIQAAKREAARQRQIRHREKDKEINGHVTRDAPAEKIDESRGERPRGLNAVGKPYSPQYDPGYKLKTPPPSIKRLYASQKNIPMVATDDALHNAPTEVTVTEPEPAGRDDAPEVLALIAAKAAISSNQREVILEKLPDLEGDEVLLGKALNIARREDAPGGGRGDQSEVGISVSASSLIANLVASTPSTRREAVEAVIAGIRQSEFDAVTNAVSDLYQRLSKAGR